MKDYKRLLADAESAFNEVTTEQYVDFVKKYNNKMPDYLQFGVTDEGSKHLYNVNISPSSNELIQWPESIQKQTLMDSDNESSINKNEDHSNELKGMIFAILIIAVCILTEENNRESESLYPLAA